MTSMRQIFKAEAPYLLFVAPAFIVYTILTIIPLAFTVYYSFTNFNGLSPDYTFVGLTNYVRSFATDSIVTSFRNSAIYGVAVPLSSHCWRYRLLCCWTARCARATFSALSSSFLR